MMLGGGAEKDVDRLVGEDLAEVGHGLRRGAEDLPDVLGRGGQAAGVAVGHVGDGGLAIVGDVADELSRAAAESHEAADDLVVCPQGSGADERDRCARGEPAGRASQKGPSGHGPLFRHRGSSRCAACERRPVLWRGTSAASTPACAARQGATDAAKARGDILPLALGRSSGRSGKHAPINRLPASRLDPITVEWVWYVHPDAFTA